MAARYFVGGTGNWSDDTNHWATSSGGSPGAGNLPTSSDDVFIDSSSGFGGGGTITLDVGVEDNAVCNDFNSTSNHTYSIECDNSPLIPYGSVVLESGLSINQDAINFSNTTSETFTVNNATLFGTSFVGTGTITLQDDLEITDEFYQENGTFDANDHNVTANDFYFFADTGFTPTVIMGSGTWQAYNPATASLWYVDEFNGEVVTIIPETSTIKLISNDLANNFTENIDGFIATGGHAYNNIWLTGAGTEYFAFYGSSTFNDLKCDNPPHAIYIYQGTTITVTTFTVSGTMGNLITLSSDNGVDQFTLSKSSGVVSCDYLDISNSNATGGAAWYAGSHSADTTNNDGWIFEDQPHRSGASNFQDPGVV